MMVPKLRTVGWSGHRAPENAESLEEMEKRKMW
jgi:hypothetical protein